MNHQHPLEAWRRSKGLRVIDAATMLGISAVSFYRLTKGKQRPSLGLIERAIQVTKGSVTANEMVAGAPPAEAA